MRALLVLAILLAAPRALPAQPADPARQAEAEERFRKAEALYHGGDYLGAAAEYQAAYDLSGLAGLLYNVAQSYRLGGEKRRAAELYRLFLEREPAHEKAGVARGHLEALERELAAAERPPESHERPVVRPPLGGDGTCVAASELEARGRGLRVAGLATAAVSLLALGAALHYGVEAKKASDAVNGNGEAWTEELLARYEQGESAETKMFVFSAIGGTALVAGGVLYYLGWRAGRAEQPVAVSVTPGAAAASLTLSGRF